MFKREPIVDDVVTVIGPSVQVEGELVASGDVVIEGTVSGTVRTEKNLRVGEHAKLFADVSAANASIAGEIQGSVTVRQGLELATTAKVFGDIQTSFVTIASGAVLQGRLQAGNSPRAVFESISQREKNRLKPKDQEEFEPAPAAARVLAEK